MSFRDKFDPRFAGEWSHLGNPTQCVENLTVDEAVAVRLGYTVATASETPGRTVLLIHGAPWRRYASRHVLEPLALAGHRVIAHDNRGAGASIKPRDGYASCFEAPGSIWALCEIYRELDNDARIHREDMAQDGQLAIPVLASGGGAQALAKSYGSMTEDVANNVAFELIPDSGHWGAEEKPEAFVSTFLTSDDSERN